MLFVIFLKIRKMKKTITVKMSSKILSSIICSTISRDTGMLPNINVYRKSGAPRAKQISKMLLPNALDTASS